MIDAKTTQNIWNDLGPWWDEKVGDGDAFHRTFIFPTIKKLIQVQKGQKVVDLGCGNGSLIRELYVDEVEYLGIDFSASLLTKAKERTLLPHVNFELGDLTAENLYLDLKAKGPWDIILCSMVLHDCPDIKPLAKNISSLLRIDGEFIFSIPHPCFNTPPYMRFVHQDGELITDDGAITLTGYSQIQHFVGKGKPNQPIEHHNFHRPVSVLLKMFFDQGLVLSAYEEPVLRDLDRNYLTPESLWSKLSEFPPALTCKIKRIT
jgi:SAM-dependent methyltransferase